MNEIDFSFLKADLRKSTALRIANLSKEEFRIQTEKTCDAILNDAFYKSCDAVFLYRALPNELSVENVFLKALDDKKMCLFPKTFDGGKMDFYIVESFDESLFEKGKFSVYEPDVKKCGLFLPEEWSSLKNGILIIAPGVAFGRDCSRLGHGKGFYDRYLLRIKNEFRHELKVYGAAFNEQIVDSVPCGENDIFMDKVFSAGNVFCRGCGE